ncbi:MAG: histone acetyltransferase, partial [Acidobacteriota bacterium]
SHYEAGAWRPYSRPELLEVLIECMRRVPPYCRVTRVIRDIPGDDILVGNKTTNLRAVAERELRSRGWPCRDIRSREIRSGTVAVERLELGEVRYETPIGEEVFLQFVTEDDRIVGFLRLALPERESYLEEIGRSAVVREVHVYGATASLGEKDELKSQHLGLGRKLIRRAETLARQAGYLDLAVISSVGTREYYRRQGFADGTLYQHRRLEAGGHGCFSASAMKRAP